MSAQALNKSESYLGEFYRRMRARLGAPKAITAAAHKLARIVYHLVTTKDAYNESVFEKTNERFVKQKEAKLIQQAKALGFLLTPISAASGEVVP